MYGIVFVLQNKSQRLERSEILEWNDTGCSVPSTKLTERIRLLADIPCK